MSSIQYKEFESDFLDNEMSQICFGLYQIIFKFNNNINISVESKVVYSKGGDNWLWSSGESSIIPLQWLLHRKVKEISASEDSILLAFDDSSVLKLVSNRDGLESIQISIGSRLIVIY
jgi:hypothetical protein